MGRHPARTSHWPRRTKADRRTFAAIRVAAVRLCSFTYYDQETGIGDVVCPVRGFEGG
jgi:hypothetical protein